MWISLTSCIRSNHHHRGAQEFDKMPSRARNGEEVIVMGHIAEDLESGVVLKEQVHFYTYTTDVFEHVAELHVFRV